MKKLITIISISLVIAWFLMIITSQYLNFIKNKPFFEIERQQSNKNELYLLTISNNEYSKLRLLMVKKYKGCDLKRNYIIYKESTVEIWEITCEK